MIKSTIAWCDLTWNPIMGCANGCPYCYARRIATNRLAHLCPQCATFTPHFHAERLDQPLHVKKPAIIFADSMSDWWSDEIDWAWRAKVWDIMWQSPQHRFVVLTKQPQRVDIDSGCGVDWPSNAWLGVSITSGADWWRWETLAKLPERIHKFISVEPLLSYGVGLQLFDSHPRPEWVIVGPQSGPNAKVPCPGWQAAIRLECLEPIGRLPIPLFEKDHKHNRLPIQPLIKQMPPDLASVFRKGGLDNAVEPQ